MPGKSADLEELNLDWQFGLGTYNGAGLPDDLAVTDYNVELWIGDPEDGGVQVTGGSYAAEPVPIGSAGWNRVDNVVSNDAEVDFGTASADWSPGSDPEDRVSHFLIRASTTRYWSAALAVPRLILTGDPVSFPAGSLTFTED